MIVMMILILLSCGDCCGGGNYATAKGSQTNGWDRDSTGTGDTHRQKDGTGTARGLKTRTQTGKENKITGQRSTEITVQIACFDCSRVSQCVHHP